MDSGGQCVMMDGTTPTHKLCVGNWDILQSVSSNLLSKCSCKPDY